MRKIMCIFLLTALLLSTLAACNAPDKTPDGTPDNVGNDTSADTTTAATPAETTVVYADTTETIKGLISCADNMNLSEIKVDIYKIIYSEKAWDPNPRDAIMGYQPHLDFSGYEHAYEYLSSVYTDNEGKFSFETSVDAPLLYVSFDVDTLPDGYGIRSIQRELIYFDKKQQGGFGLAVYGSTETASAAPTAEFILEPIADASITFGLYYDGFLIASRVYNDNGNALYAKSVIVNGRFNDNFIDAMINGGDLTYTAMIQSGDFSKGVSQTLEKDMLLYTTPWERRVEYLYYNNYITKEQYDNIVATTPPSDAGNGWT